MQSVTLLDTTYEKLNVVGLPQRGAGYNNSIGNNHTVSITLNNFVGRIWVEGSLASDPTDGDWFPIPLVNNQPYVQFPVNPLHPTGNGLGIPGVSGDSGTLAYSFTGNFIWIRAKVDRTYLIPPPVDARVVGTVMKIWLNYGAVSPAAVVPVVTPVYGGQGPQGPAGATGATSTVPGPTGSQGEPGPTGPSNNPGGTNGAIQYALDGNFAGNSNNLFYDHIGIRLAIGTNDTSSATLTAQGALPSLFNTLNGSNPTIIVGDTATDGLLVSYNVGNQYGYLKTADSINEMITLSNQGVGINGVTPNNTLDVSGSAVIGGTYAGIRTAPINGLLVQGAVGIGTGTVSAPNKIEVFGGNAAFNGNVSIGTKNATDRLNVVGGNIHISTSPYGIKFPDGSFQNTASSGIQGPTGPTGPAAAGSYSITESTASAGQTEFVVDYFVGYIDVYKDGIRLNSDQFVATTGNAVSLITPCVGGEKMLFVAWSIVTIMPTTPIVIPNLVAAADDTEASNLGVPINGIYQSSGVVRIRLV